MGAGAGPYRGGPPGMQGGPPGMQGSMGPPPGMGEREYVMPHLLVAAVIVFLLVTKWNGGLTAHSGICSLASGLSLVYKKK